MTKTYSYCDTTIAHILRKLNSFKNQGQPKDYEIRIDNITAVSRTKDLGNFDMFKDMLTSFSRKVSVLFYQGKSRKYDRYDLNLPDSFSKDSLMVAQEYIDQEVSSILKQERKDMKWAALKSENKQLKKDNKRLRGRNLDLEAKQSGEIREIISLITSQLPLLKKNEGLSSEINGIPVSDLMMMINDYRKKWGDLVFGRVLSTMLLLGENLTLLKKVEELIKLEGNGEKE